MRRRLPGVWEACSFHRARCRAASSFKGKKQHSQDMTTFSVLASVPSDPLVPFTDQLRLAMAAHLARFKGSSREHTESDLRC